ncbi:hypothetical protein C8R44DRAFT_815068 [Mycena epipterygia]|nr:hypothetical protein C8R44DRAFT_815068 [Mycena epipterygia]
MLPTFHANLPTSHNYEAPPARNLCVLMRLRPRGVRRGHDQEHVPYHGQRCHDGFDAHSFLLRLDRRNSSSDAPPSWDDEARRGPKNAGHRPDTPGTLVLTCVHPPHPPPSANLVRVHGHAT